MFDNNWEKNIYSRSKQKNDYPFDWLITSTKRFIKNYHSKKVVELGCGTGNNLILFKNLGFKKIEGVEGSKTASKIADKRFYKAKNIKIINQDFSKFHFKKNNYNLIIDRGSLTHNEKNDIRMVIDHAYYSLKPGGYIFSSLFSKNHSSFAKKKFFFKKETKTSSGLITSFLNLKEINSIFKKFKIVSLVHETKLDIKSKKRVCWWYLIAKKGKK